MHNKELFLLQILFPHNTQKVRVGKVWNTRKILVEWIESRNVFPNVLKTPTKEEEEYL